MDHKFSVREFSSFAIKVIVAHTITYFFFGLIMSNIFNYAKLFDTEIIRDFMRPIDSAYILLGPLLQPIRGIIFAFGIWPIRKFIVDRKYGWLILWNIIVVFGILSTPAAAPCSIEGLLYTKLPISFHLIGLPEILLQTLTFSLLLYMWIKPKTEKESNLQNSKLKVRINKIMLAIMTACFAYIGYAAGGILIAKLAEVEINFNEVSSSLSFKSQYMFIVAFIINVLSVLWFSKMWIDNRVKLITLSFVFWLIDTSVPLIYQWIFSYPMSFHFAIILGFFPSLIIILTLKFNRAKFEVFNERHSN